jgi:membrane-associated protease RseP (regulator of RpoE activity)
MLESMIGSVASPLALLEVLATAKSYLLIFAGFSLVIFVHELGHFLAAKACGVRVDKFAIGFGRELFGFTRGETRYAFNVLPLGGYVKMFGQEDFALDKSGEWKVKEDPRSFTHKPIYQRMIIVSAGVFMNLVFAAATFAVVFMLGLPSMPAEIGQLQAGMPAERAGLRIGDRLIRINNQTITDYTDLQAAIILSNPDEQLKIEYERKDPRTEQWKTESVVISPEMSQENNVLRIGVAPPRTNEVGEVINDPRLPEDQQIRAGDRVVAVNGTPIDSWYQIQDILADLEGRSATLTVERPLGGPAPRPGPPAESQPTEVRRMEVPWRAREYFLSTGKSEDSGHLLGFVPRARVSRVTEGQRGDVAGIKTGDVIAKWGGQISPRLDEINQSRRDNPERDIRVTVYRPGAGEKSVVLRPKVSGFFSRGNPSDGVLLSSQENDQLVVADIVADAGAGITTPAADLKELMPRGSLITRVDNQPVKTWDELSRAFIRLAGRRVKVAWSFEGQKEQSGEIYVPHTIGTTFRLPGARQIVSINGVARKEVEVNNRRMTLSADNWMGAREILRDCIGQDVKVVYRDNMRPGELQTAEVKVAREMLDTWVLRTLYVVDDMLTFHRTITVKETNPLKASVIGLRKTWYFIEQVYLTMQRMIFTRSMSVDQVSGPVGIFQMGSQVAAAGSPQLLYFLALISANLAVINFLPLPIMDGGIFVFLLIEKIKGSPLSMRIQVATQLIGLALIIGIFLFVTFQDIQKLAG